MTKINLRSMIKVTKIHARQIFDARGNPTTEVDIVLNDKAFGRASTPSGASVGTWEAKELRDGDDEYFGTGVKRVINSINNDIAPKLMQQTFETQQDFDDALITLDGTPDKSNIGANASIPLSIAFCKAYASHKNKPIFQSIQSGSYTIPKLMLNVINGGKHADNKLDVQEFMIVPQSNELEHNLLIAHEVSHHLKNSLKSKGYNTNVGDEGGFAPQLSHQEEAIDILLEALHSSKHSNHVKLALDIAASELYDGTLYSINGTTQTSEELVHYYHNMLQQYPEIISLEDPFAEDDENGWSKGTAVLATQLVGDDLFVTNINRLRDGIQKKQGNAILIKPNQIGTISETIQAIKLAQQNQYKIILSHRSGETEDTFISHLAVAVGADYIKTGALCRGERVAKYNELVRIAEII